MHKIIIDIYSTIDQFEDEKHVIEMMTEGEWFEKNGSVFLVYYETEVSGMEGSKTMLKIQEDSVVMTRFGDTNSRMIFKLSEVMESVYKTPYGSFDMRIETSELEVNLDKEQMCGSLKINYQMTLEGVSNSINELLINVRLAG